MSTTIDEKVVEMRFDNKDFESNVTETMSTLDKLKQSLNFDSAVDGFDTISKAAGSCDMSSLGSSVDSVQVKFSALQVVAVSALQSITNSAISAGEQLLSSLTVDNISAGWEKFGENTKNTGTLVSQGFDLDEVEEQLDRLLWYTDETSYNYTDMVSNIAKFTAAGQGLEDSVTAMMGIANWAALSGENASSASAAMYQLSQAMSSGSMRLTDWMSIETHNMASEEFMQQAIDAGVALGTLKDNLDGTYSSLVGTADAFNATSGFRDSLTKGAWLTSDVLMATFEKYASAVDDIYAYTEEYGVTASEAIEILGDDLDEFGLKALKAGQEARTYADAIDSVKDALSTAFMNTFELIFGDYEEATALWTELANSLYDIFVEPVNVFNEMLEGALGNPFSELIDTIDSVTGATEAMTTAVTDYGSVVDDVIGGLYGNGQSRWDALAEAGYDWAYVQNLVNEQLGDSTRHATDYAEAEEDLNETTATTIEELLEMSDAELENLGFTEDVIEGLRELQAQSEKTGIPIEELAEDLNQLSGRSLLIDSFRNIGESLLAIMNAIGEAWGEIFPAITSEQLYDTIAAFHKFTTYLEVNDETADKLKRTLKGLFAILDIITTITGGALKTALKVVSKLLGMMDVDILGVTANIGDAIVAFHDWLLEDSLLAKAFELVADTLASGIAAVRDWIDEFKESEEVQAAIQGIQEWAANLFDTLQQGTENVLPTVESALTVISNVIGGMVSTIGKVIDQVKTWIDAFLQIPEVQEAITLLGDALEGIRKHFSDAITNFSTFIDHVKELDGISLDNIGEIFKMFKEDVLNDFLDIDGVFENLKQGLGKLKDAISDKLSGISPVLDTVKEKITEFLTFLKDTFGGKLGSILTIGVGAAIILLASKISKIVGAISSPFGAISELIETLTGTIKAAKLPLMASALAMVAGAMLLMAVALMLLTQAAASDPKAFSSAAAALFLLSVGMAAMAAALAQISKMGNLTEAGGAVLMLAGSLLVLALALKVLVDLVDNGLWDAMGALGVLAVGLMAVVAAVMLLSSKLGSGGSLTQSTGTALIIVGFAAALYIMVEALAKLSDVPIKNIEAVMPALLSMIGMLALIALACGKLSIGSAVGAIAIVLALKLLVGSMEDIANVDVALIMDHLDSFIVVFGMLGALMLLSRVAGKNAAKAGVMILSISVSLLLIVAAIKLLEGVKSAALGRATAAIMGIMAVFGVLIALSALSGKNAAKAGVMLLAMSTAILILVAAIALLCLIDDPEGVNRALGAIVALMAMFTVLIAVTALAKDAKGTLIILTVAIGMMAIALGALSMIPTENLNSAVAALAVVMGMFTVMIAATSLAKSATGTLVVLTLVVAGLAAVLYALSGLPAGSALASAEALSVLLLAFSASLLIISKASTVSASALVAMAIMTVIVAGLAAILGVLDALDVAPSIETAAALSILLLSLSAACLVLSKVPSTGATSGIIAMIEVVAALVLLVEGLGALVTYFPNIETFIDSGFGLLETFATGLGTCIGNFISGIGVGLTSGLPEMGTNLSEFWDNISPFLEGVSGLDSSAVDGVSALVDVITSLLGAEILSSITSWLTGDTDDMGEFGSSLNAYIGCIVEANDALTDLELDADKFKMAAKAGEAMDALADVVPKTGGVWQHIIGESDISDFGTKIEAYIEAIVTAYEAMSGKTISSSKFATVSQSGIYMVEMCEALKNTDMPNDDKVSKYANAVTSIGEALGKFARATLNADGAHLSAITSQASKLVDLMEDMNALSGTDGVSSFVSGLSTLGEASVDSYVSAFTGSDSKVSSAVTGLVDSIVNGLSSQTSRVSSAFSTMLDAGRTALRDGYESLKIIGQVLVDSLNGGITDRKSQAKQAFATIVDMAKSAVRGYYTDFRSAGIYLVTGFANGISSTTYLATAKASAMASAANTAARKALDEHSPSKEGYQTGSFFGQGFVNGIVAWIATSGETSAEMANMALSSLTSTLNNLSDVIDQSMDSEPTIRPVLDLSDIKSGASQINSMLSGAPALAYSTSMAGQISTSMREREIQNGSEGRELLQAIKGLGKNLADRGGNTYNTVNGITYDDGSNVTDAVRSLIRAAKIERRT